MCPGEKINTNLRPGLALFNQYCFTEEGVAVRLKFSFLKNKKKHEFNCQHSNMNWKGGRRGWRDTLVSVNIVFQ